MKCPKCAHNQLVKDGLRCGKCGYPFAFNRKVDGITDGKFLALLRTASKDDAHYFTYNQLYAAHCKRAGKYTGDVGCGAGCLGIVLGLGALNAIGMGAYMLWDDAADMADAAAGWNPGIVLLPAGLLLGVLALFLLVRALSTPPERRPNDQLDEWLERWLRLRPIEKLVRKPSLAQEPGLPYRERDLHDYGVEKLLIVDDDLLVDLFVKNGLHAEHRALVLSESGYPEYLLPTARRLLEERSDLPIVALHGSTANGVAMVSRLAHSTIFPLQGRQIFDAGLSPMQVPGIRALDPVAPKTMQNAVPVDYLPYGSLAAGVGGALATGLLLSTAIAQAADAHDPDGWGSSFG